MAIGDAPGGGYFSAADMYLAMYPDVMAHAQNMVRGRGVEPGTQSFRDALRNVAAQHYNDYGVTEKGRRWGQAATGLLDDTPNSPVQQGPIGWDIQPAGSTVDVGNATWTAGPLVPFKPGTYDLETATTYNQDPAKSPYQEFQDAVNAGQVDDLGNPKTVTSAPAPGTTSSGGAAAMLAGMVGGNTPGPRSPFGKSSRYIG